MSTKRVRKLWLAGLLALLVGLPLGYYQFILDWEGRPFCHKQVMFGFMHWMEDNGMDINSHTNVYPNVNGKGMDSLATISNQMAGHMEWVEGYRYVAGLREDDPGDLVLMYLDRPTRWIWHGPAPTVFEEKAWIVVPADFTMGGRSPAGPGELSERVSRAEFSDRLRRTLEFVRTNERPYWQSVVTEHTKFLDSLAPVVR